MYLKYVHNYTGSSEATIRLYNEIGGMFGINGVDVCNEMVYLSEIGVTKINVRINSPGGSVLDGQTIIACIRELQNKGIVVDTYNEYMAASIAGVIFSHGSTRYMASNGLFMMHNPSGGGDDAKSLEILEKIKESIAEQIAAKSGKDIAVVKKMMSKETWMNADEAIEGGFADAKFNSVVNITENINSVSKLFEISNRILTKKVSKMEKLINKFNLNNNATEEEVIAEIEKVEAAKNEVEKELNSLKEKAALLEKEISEMKEKEAVLLVENSIREGKIKAESKELMIENAKKDIISFKNFLSAIPALSSNGFRNVVGKKDEKDERKDWTFSDWKKKDPAGLLEMATNEPEMYRNLFNKTN